MISEAPLKTMWYSWNSTFIWLALPDPWLQFGRVMWYVKLPSKLCCTHATQLSFISLSQICDSNLGALSMQPPPSLPQWTCFLQPVAFSSNPKLCGIHETQCSFGKLPWLQFGTRYVICQTSLQAMLYSCNPAFIHFAFPDLWLRFGRVLCYSTSPLAASMNMFFAAFRFVLQPLLLSFVLFPTNVNFVLTLCSVLSPLSTLHCLRPSRSSYPVLSPRLLCLPDHISGNSGFRPPLLRYYIVILFVYM